MNTQFEKPISARNAELEKELKEKTHELNRKNHELEIEASLERVRLRAMSMRSSTDVGNATAVLFSELENLGIKTIRCGIIIGKKEEEKIELWTATAIEEGQVVPIIGEVDVNIHPLLKNSFEAWLEKKEFYSFKLEGQDKELYYQSLATSLNYPIPFEESSLPDHYCTSFMFIEGGLFAFTFEPFSPENITIFKKFANVFSQTYRRYLDLKKAEAQAREAQIELGLERVRARAMAMYNSSELAEVATLLFEQLKHLGVESYSSGFNIWDKEHKNLISWMSNPSGSLNPPFEMPIRDYEQHKRIYDSWKKHKSFMQDDIKGKALIRHYKFLRSFPLLDESFKIGEAAGFKIPDRQVHNIAFFTNGYLLFITLQPCEQYHSIFQRFAKAFDQTYTRFLDLQKAEAQAREAQIEASLERVRSKTMAMHNSQDVGDTVATMFEEFVKLGIKTNRCGILIFSSTLFAEVWTARSNPEGKATLIIGQLDLAVHPLLTGIHQSWKNKDQFFTYPMFGDDLVAYYRAINETKYYPTHFNIEDLPSREFHSDFYFSEGSIFAFTAEPIPNEATLIFKRFAGVFGQTYRRYLDLQRAEAQTREAQIEAALEKVRGKAMALHNSNDLSVTASLVFTELRRLGINPLRCGVGILVKENRKAQLYSATSSSAGDSLSLVGWVELSGHAVLRNIYDSWLKHEDYFPELTGEQLKLYYEKLLAGLSLPAIPDWTKGEKQYGHFLPFSAGCLYAWSDTPYDESEIKILKRFAYVIDLTFRRYIELQKLEAQAHEAQIEAALERVRASTMAMHKSEQLPETAQVLFEQFAELGKTPDRIAIGIVNEELQRIEWWVTDQMGSQVTHQFEASVLQPSIAKYFSAWKEGKDALVVDLSGVALKEWIRFVKDEVKMPLDESQIKGRRVQHAAFFSRGLLLISAHEPMADEIIQLLVRFANVFNQTYTRFLDLQKAEAQAREAMKQSSLDRVRGQIASMRTVDDLQRITPVIWHELNALGVPFIRCGIFIVEEEKSNVRIYLTTPDGKPLGALRLPVESTSLTRNIVHHWEKGVGYREHWSRDQFIEWAQSMLELGQIQDRKTYQGSEQPPESLDLHFVPFKQGMLYVGNTSLLSEDKIDLVKSLAEAFSIAYARYEDFDKLEKAKESIEATLTELKATQSQLIQSEKMASLGELTAGIAHEIQNPLNFVNNFSEVSKELLDEMKTELDNGNTEDAKELSNDVIQNLEKINHHGKRADAIVKGMLQHSRTSTGQREPTDINALADEYLRLAYHGLRAKDKSFNATMKTDFDESIGKINVVPQDIGRVILNLITNAFYAVKAPLPPEGGFKDPNYIHQPTVTVKTSFIPPSGGQRGAVLISVRDNGPGIPSQIIDKIFQPFFTTKPTGQGTGLGLSLSYDIVKAHGGEIKVETKENEGTEFIIQLPAL